MAALAGDHHRVYHIFRFGLVNAFCRASALSPLNLLPFVSSQMFWLHFTIIGVFFTFILINYKNKKFYFVFFNFRKKMYIFFFYGVFFNFIYNKMFILLIKLFYIINIKYIEKGFLELYGPIGLYLKFRELSFLSKK